MRVRRGDGWAPKGAPYSLTSRELRILRLVAGGQNLRQVAQVLDVDAIVVERHMRSIRKKVSVRSTTEAAIKAIKEQLVADPPAEERSA